MVMPSSDALIVGAGPAGLAAAIALRRCGADVLVADALRPPIDKACGEGLMPEAVRELSHLGIALEARHGSPFHGIAFVSGNTRAAADFSHGNGVGVRRTTLHQLLLDRATELGVRFSWNTPAVMKQGQPIALGGHTGNYRWLIGADGHASRVRAWAGLDKGALRSRRFGFRAHFPLRPWSSHVEVHWGMRGQAYITPVGQEEICVSAMTRHAGQRLNDILASIPSLRGRFNEAEITNRPSIGPERGSLTLIRRLDRVTRGNVALIGDASGSADAITGEGLALAFRQASLLAESLQAGSLDLYQTHHAAILALPQRMSKLLLLLDRNPRLRHRAISVFAARPALFRELLAVHTGDQPLQRFILRHGPTLGALLVQQRSC
ncbi:MAG TPA: FAD-dependent monooxygenase [Acidobacteriaceae bacterium]|jgi:flavin-dependent dehydrogenase|nr:FAD-dependent monooxygenase [Acidobacteriaceae bacterium]